MLRHVGIDNGVTGTIGIITPQWTMFHKMPVKRHRDYTIKEQYLHRIYVPALIDILDADDIIFLERPMVNPRAFKATQSALRSLEATLIAMEMAGAAFSYVDSREWQKEFFSSGIIGHDELKLASQQVGLQLFPEHKEIILKHGDADGLLIAEYARRTVSG